MTPLDRRLETRLVEVSRHLRRHFEAVCGELGLTPPQAAALRDLDENAPMRELADRLGCDASYVTGLADVLEARGLVERRPDPDDRRIKQLQLTSEGTRLKTALEDRLIAGNPLLLALSNEEKDRLDRLLERALAALDDAGSPLGLD